MRRFAATIRGESTLNALLQDGMLIIYYYQVVILQECWVCTITLI